MNSKNEETLSVTPAPLFVIPWTGRVLIIGMGAVGRGLLPLLRCHFARGSISIVAIDPDPRGAAEAENYGVEFLQTALTAENYGAVIDAVFGGASNKFIVNVSTNVSSQAIIDYASRNGALYVDTTIDPWPGVYFSADLPAVDRSNYSLRHSLLAARKQWQGGPTAVSCCGANPGAASWFVKQALLNLARDFGSPTSTPSTSSQWAELMMQLGVKGVHIAERDWQIPAAPVSAATLTNTWSAEGFLAESLQPAELGWGTHEKSFPVGGVRFGFGCDAAILIDRPSASVKVWTWTPTAGGHHAYLITHNEAISISDYFTARDERGVSFRPTCHYAYRPIDAACAGIETVIAGGGASTTELRVLSEHDLTGGYNELGVLLYGHRRNAYWFGSRLSLSQARQLAPLQNATILQVTSAVLAGMAWAVANPRRGLVEAEEMDFAFCLQHQSPYLGELFGTYTNWLPPRLLANVVHEDDCRWQFSNVRV